MTMLYAVSWFSLHIRHIGPICMFLAEDIPANMHGIKANTSLRISFVVTYNLQGHGIIALKL